MEIGSFLQFYAKIWQNGKLRSETEANLRAKWKRNHKRNGSIREEKKFIPPSVDEVISYFKENGYSMSTAKRAYGHYAVADWHDTNGKPVKSWKQKMGT